MRTDLDKILCLFVMQCSGLQVDYLPFIQEVNNSCNNVANRHSVHVPLRFTNMYPC